MKIVSIDPSVNRVGWAVVDGLRKDEDGVWHDENADWKFGYWNLGSLSLQFKFKELTEWMILTFGGLNEDDILIVEWPGYFEAARGQIAAQKGYTINLAAMCAYVAGYFRLPWENWVPIKPSQWKGSVPKEITRMRFFKAMGIPQIYKIDHNAVDAVMMLLEFCKRKRITAKIVSQTAQPYYPAD
jgi:hypothetical protein